MLASDNPNHSLGLVIYDVARQLRINFDRRATGIGMSRAQFSILVALKRNEGQRQVDLAEAMELKPISVVRLLDKLEKQGLIERRDDPDDRRAKRLYLTAKAAPLLDKLWIHGAETRKDALAGFTPEEDTQLMELLMRIRTNLSEKNQTRTKKAVAA